MRSRLEYIFKGILIFAILMVIINQKFLTIIVTGDSANIGLIITYLVVVSALASPILFSFSSMAKSGSAIQRLEEYCNWTDHEKSFYEPKPSSTSWP